MSSLLLLGAHRSYHLYRKETDMRKGFNQLCGIITGGLGRIVTQGDAFIKGKLVKWQYAEQLFITAAGRHLEAEGVFELDIVG